MTVETRRELTCIGCPMGCRLVATLDGDGKFLSVEGYSCAVGKKYGEEEVTCPKRTVTALMRAKGTHLPLSVKTSAPVEKRLVFDCLGEIARSTAEPPVDIGDVMIKNVCGTGADIVATRCFRCERNGAYGNGK